MWLSDWLMHCLQCSKLAFLNLFSLYLVRTTLHCWNVTLNSLKAYFTASRSIFWFFSYISEVPWGVSALTRSPCGQTQINTLPSQSRLDSHLSASLHTITEYIFSDFVGYMQNNMPFEKGMINTFMQYLSFFFNIKG